MNEFNYNYLLKGAKKYNCKSIIEVLKLKKVSTFTKDTKQDYNLDPWVQSVSINTGKSSKKHKVLKLGQRIKNDTSQIWDILSKNKVTCSVYGTMNSRLRINKYLNYYLPDPWNFKDKTWPKNLMGLFFTKLLCKNYLKFSFEIFLLFNNFFYNVNSKFKIFKSS